MYVSFRMLFLLMVVSLAIYAVGTAVVAGLLHLSLGHAFLLRYLLGV
jgi:hypothetical protein